MTRIARIEEMAIKLDELAQELDPYDYESNVAYHVDLLTRDPLDVIGQLVDTANELLQQACSR